jgi:hypothetical protein
MAGDGSQPGAPPLSVAVARGCLLGLALAGMWGVFGVGLYVLVRVLGGSLGLGVLAGAAGGPAIGSALFLLWWIRQYGAKAPPVAHPPEPTDGQNLSND